MKKKVIGVVLAALLSSPVRSAGFPVLDSTNLLQSVTEYSLILKEYEQILKQTGLEVNQLLTLIEQYEQTLREYQIILNQVTRLKNKIDRRDIPGLERDLRKLYEQYQGEVETPTHKEVERRYGSLSTKEEVHKLAEDAIGYVPDDLSQSYTLANDINVQAHQKSQFSQRASNTRSDISRVDEERLNLGDQSELATLQLIVEQNQILMEQIDLQNEIQLAEFSHAYQSDHRLSKAIFDARERQLRRIKEANEKGITIDERKIL
ncbi:hypothetical protein [Vibrio coralliilyticus]|uniref:hypothetical protein n=1 Tax=Vibrio coralliilyticus TaxID=190893 RepID=UPI000C172F32|nr:hypothetical protein [Vibrio coralliilyticus]